MEQPMSLNYLFHRHQVSLMRAASAMSIDVRRTHEAFAAAYADRISSLTDTLGATTAPLVRS